MPRVKRGTLHSKRRRNILKLVKGYKAGRKSKLRQAREAILHAGTYAYRDRRNKKRCMRRLWQIKIGSAVKKEGNSYSKFIKQMKDKKIEIDRKILSQLLETNPEIFQTIYKEIVK